MRPRILAVFALVSSLGAAVAQAEVLWINTGFSMYSVDSASPGTILTGPLSYSGTVGGEAISAFDFSPATGVLYGYTYSSGRLYTLDTSSGSSTLVGTSATTLNPFLGMTFEGASKIRIVHASGSQFTIDPATGSLLSTDTTTAEDGLVGLGYNELTSTTYAMEDGTGFLYRLGSLGGSPDGPSTGLVELVGATSIFSSRTYNMDISAATGTAYVDDGGGGGGGTLNLYTVDLLAGAKTYLGPLALPFAPGNGIAVQPVPEPISIAIFAISALLLVLGLRRTR